MLCHKKVFLPACGYVEVALFNYISLPWSMQERNSSGPGKIFTQEDDC